MSEITDPTAVAEHEDAPIGSQSDVLEGLNESQREAVTHLGGPLLIVAGAGSGKTRTLTRRFEWLVRGGVPADRILALTYTNDAAAELAERIESAIGESLGETNATTFHALCLSLLKDEYLAAKLNPFFSTADGPDRVAIMLARLNELSFDRLAIRGRAPEAIKNLNEFIDRLKEDCIGPEDLQAYANGALADAVDPDSREQAELLLEKAQYYVKHDQFMRDAAALGFGDLQYETYKLLSDNENARRRIARRFDHILVDEFQDTSFVQLEILRLLAEDHHNIAAVGDDDQSIYRFRGASPRSIINFGDRFGDFRRIELELNYRSAPAIIAAARMVIGAIPGDRRVEKQLTAGTDREGDVEFWHSTSEVAEAQAIVAEIERLIEHDDVQPREICIITSKRAHADRVVERLAVHQIPHVVTTKDFFQRTEIRVPLSWLKVLANPTLNEDAWRMLAAAPINLDSAEHATLMRWMSKQKLPHVVAAMRSAARGKQFTPVMLDKFRVFLQIYDEFTALLDDQRPGEFLIRLVNRIAIKGMVLMENYATAPDRLANLAKLQEMAEIFADRQRQATARDFALYITAMAEADFDIADAHAETDPNSVRVMTAHGSKGLEFDHVFMPGMTDACWPGRRSSAAHAVPDVLLKEPVAPLPGKDGPRAQHIEDTRRLAHVSMTRARKQLVLSYYDSPKARHKPSVFYTETLELSGGSEQFFEERAFDSGEFVYMEMEDLRRELMESVDETGAQLGEMRLDASAGAPSDFARFAELIKLSALGHRVRHGQSIGEALPEINAMLTGSMSPAQRSEFEHSKLDQRLLSGDESNRRLAQRTAAMRAQIGNFIPTVDGRLRLSASDIGVYQRCPKMYEYEKVMKVPTREQSHLRLGILVHNVLERYHRDFTERPAANSDECRRRIWDLLDTAIAIGGWGNSDDERQLLDRARAMLDEYACSDFALPTGEVRTETKFSLRLPATTLMKTTPVGGKKLNGIQINGKIDRIEALDDGSSRLVDYKTGKRKTAGEVAKDLQLALYKLAASRELGIDASTLIYYYLEHEGKGPAIEAEASEERIAEVLETVNQVADSIVQLDFTPDPSYDKCRVCAYRWVCPATEA